MRYIQMLMLFVFLFLYALSVQATDFSAGASVQNELANFSPKEIVEFSKKVERTLAAKGAHVAILARMGRPVSELPKGMHFTHVGFAVYSEIVTSDGRKVPGYAIYNLYQREKSPDVSDLVQDFPVDFFSGVSVLEAGIIIPSIELQKRLLSVINSPTYVALHNPNYSVIANPYKTSKQNCTAFVLDVINSAIYQTNDINIIKLNERKFFTAQEVNVNPVKLMMGALFSSEVAMSDQDDTPVTATFETISRYLVKFDNGAEILSVFPDS